MISPTQVEVIVDWVLAEASGQIYLEELSESNKNGATDPEDR